MTDVDCVRCRRDRPSTAVVSATTVDVKDKKNKPQKNTELSHCWACREDACRKCLGWATLSKQRRCSHCNTCVCMLHNDESGDRWDMGVLPLQVYDRANSTSRVSLLCGQCRRDCLEHWYSGCGHTNLLPALSRTSRQLVPGLKAMVTLVGTQNTGPGAQLAMSLMFGGMFAGMFTKAQSLATTSNSTSCIRCKLDYCPACYDEPFCTSSCTVCNRALLLCATCLRSPSVTAWAANDDHSLGRLFPDDDSSDEGDSDDRKEVYSSKVAVHTEAHREPTAFAPVIPAFMCSTTAIVDSKPVVVAHLSPTAAIAIARSNVPTVTPVEPFLMILECCKKRICRNTQDCKQAYDRAQWTCDDCKKVRCRQCRPPTLRVPCVDTPKHLTLCESCHVDRHTKCVLCKTAKIDGLCNRMCAGCHAVMCRKCTVSEADLRDLGGLYCRPCIVQGRYIRAVHVTPDGVTSGRLSNTAYEMCDVCEEWITTPDLRLHLTPCHVCGETTHVKQGFERRCAALGCRMTETRVLCCRHVRQMTVLSCSTTCRQLALAPLVWGEVSLVPPDARWWCPTHRQTCFTCEKVLCCLRCVSEEKRRLFFPRTLCDRDQKSTRKSALSIRMSVVGGEPNVGLPAQRTRVHCEACRTALYAVVFACTDIPQIANLVVDYLYESFIPARDTIGPHSP